MGPPPLPLGTFGKVLVLDLPSGPILARADYRDPDGCVRLVSRSGRSPARHRMKQEV